MKIVVAKSAGFCFGVQRAVDLVMNAVEKYEGQKIYTYGPIIHNETVVEDLKSRGVIIMEEDKDPADYEKGIVIIRSHGVSRAVMDRIREGGHEIIDATCPFVSKIHRLASEHSAKGERIILLGDKDHPEIRGIIGWINGDGYDVIKTREEAESYVADSTDKIILLSQTTFNLHKFQELVEILTQKGYDINALNTICNATEERQEEAARIAGEVDVMFVIGGRNSSNSQKLYEICKKRCSGTYFIQTKDDFDLSVLQSVNNVGITAGASTPVNIIEEVTKKCQR